MRSPTRMSWKNEPNIRAPSWRRGYLQARPFFFVYALLAGLASFSTTREPLSRSGTVTRICAACQKENAVQTMSST